LGSLHADYVWPAKSERDHEKAHLHADRYDRCGRGAVAFITLHGEPAKATATAGIDPSLMMSHAHDLPVAHYDDYSVVFN
jgi:hypothetical protein